MLCCFSLRGGVWVFGASAFGVSRFIGDETLRFLKFLGSLRWTQLCFVRSSFSSRRTTRSCRSGLPRPGVGAAVHHFVEKKPRSWARTPLPGAAQRGPGGVLRCTDSHRLHGARPPGRALLGDWWMGKRLFGLKSHERCTLWNLWVCNELLQILQWIAWKMLVALPCIRACCSTVAVALTYPGSPTNRRADAPCLGSRHPD